MSEATAEVAGSPAPSESELANQPGQDASQVTAAEGDAEKQEQVEEKPKVFTQAEVDALIQKRLAKERRNEARRIEAQLREAQRASTLKAPERESFQDEETFTKAQIEHLAAQRAERILAERKAAEEQERRSTAFLEKVEAATERFPDFEQVVGNPDLPINDAMAEFIAESDVGPDLAYHLGKNPATASRISRMSPIQAARELTKLESELASKPKPKPSNAPEPISPIGNKGKSTTSSLPSDDDDIETWMAKEAKRMRGR